MKIEIGPLTFEIVNDKKLLTEYFMKTREEVFGYLDEERGKIVINDKYPYDVQQEVKFHEVLHAVIDLIFFEFANDEEEEKFVRAFSPALLDTLRRNPEFTKYILEK